MKFKKGEFVRVILTSEIGMIVEEYGQCESMENLTFQPGYAVRMPDYSIEFFAEFEVAKRDVKPVAIFHRNRQDDETEE